MERCLDLEESVCFRLGVQPLQEKDGARNSRQHLKKHRPESYTGAVPHWWVAVVIEEDSIVTGAKEYYMIHLDLCGAAYDEGALVNAPNSDMLVSLKHFETPEYTMIPHCDGVLGHKLYMRAMTSHRCRENPIMKNSQGRVALQPKSIRHFRCYHKADASSIEVTPVETYLERNPFSDDYKADIREMTATVLDQVILQLPIGSDITVCNIVSKPELNGRSAVVCNPGRQDVAADRIPLQISGQKKPLQLKPKCIQLPATKKQQYESLEEKITAYRKFVEKAEEGLENKEEYNELKGARYTERQSRNIKKALDDPCVEKALAVMQTGQLVFTCYGDAELKEGIEKLLKPPLDTVIPRELMATVRSGWELSNHPKADEAIKLINLMKAAKQRALMQTDDVDGIEQLLRIQQSAAQKIRSDNGLNFVFDRLQELGMYVNPAKLL